VLAQVLDYLAHLPTQFGESMPDVPKGENGEPVAEADDIRDAVSQGDVLVIIASDEVALKRLARCSATLVRGKTVRVRATLSFGPLGRCTRSPLTPEVCA